MTRRGAPSSADTCELTLPVFVVDGGGRRRLLRRAGYLLAASSVVYLAMLGFILVTGPAIHRAGATPPATQAGRPRIAPPVLRLARPPSPRPTRAPVAVAEVAVRRKPVAPPPSVAHPTAARTPAKKKVHLKSEEVTQPPLP